MKIERIETNGEEQRIRQEFGVSELCAKVLACRCQDDEQIRQVLNPDLTLHPCQSPELTQILKRLDTARQRHEKVLIAGDYDADGLCATAIMKEALDRTGIVNGFYVPHRLNEGYGLSAQTVQLAREKGYSLILTVDNGVAAHPALALAKQLGVEVIVTDHHVIQQEPECLTLLHPSRMGRPWQYCCGAGVALQLSMAMTGPRKRPIMLAAIATIADMMPLWEENRILVRLGLKYLNERQFTAIEALNEKKCELWTEKEVAYQIVPKLNAAGRLAELCNINNIVRYLLLEDPAQIESAAAQIRQINQKRRQMSDKMTKTAMEQMHHEDPFHVIADKEFHEGIIGLVAGRIMNDTHRPTLVLAPSAQGYKGSVRSVPGLDIQTFFEDLRGYLIQFGGHAQAAGIEVAADQLEPLRQAILAKMKTLNLALQEPTLQVLPVSAQEINLAALHELDQLAPFGQQFEPVTFEVSGLTILQYAKMKEVYPKWQTTNGVDLIDAISFNRELDNPHPVSWIGQLQINRFRGREKCSILVETVE